MKEIALSFLLGIAFGILFAGGYYDGFVADEYKKKLNEAGKALDRAAKEIKMRDQDINILLQYIEEMKLRNKRLEKSV